MKNILIKNLLALSLVLLSTASIQAQEELDENAPEVSTTEEPIYEIVAVEATYPGGTSALLADFAENFEYPEEAREKNVQGRLLVNFVVEKDGSINHVKVTRKLGSGLDEAAVNAIKSIKDFTPAYQNGEPVRSYYTLPVLCRLD